MEKYRILYEDRDVFAICKAPGFPVQSARPSMPDVMSLLRNELTLREGKEPYLGLVNRLDQPVEGIFLIGRNRQATARLCADISGHMRMEKYYRALVWGRMDERDGRLMDYLARDGRNNLSSVVPAGAGNGKRSELLYRTLEEWEGKSLLEIRLLTGRHHQIRAQLAHAGAPVVGDAKYGKADSERRQLCLCSYKMTFVHPRTGAPMTFQVEPSFSLPGR